MSGPALSGLIYHLQILFCVLEEHVSLVLHEGYVILLSIANEAEQHLDTSSGMSPL